jgi:hypothetical protein
MNNQTEAAEERLCLTKLNSPAGISGTKDKANIDKITQIMNYMTKNDCDRQCNSRRQSSVPYQCSVLY